jgi:uncharacterized phage-associated protein
MEYYANEVAAFLIDEAIKMNKPINNIKLQYILYFIWKDYYILKNEDLFFEFIEAWKFGPAIAKVYYQFCTWGAMPIDDIRAIDNIFITIVEDDRKILKTLLLKYINLTVYQLNQMIKREAPWYRTFNNGEGTFNIIPIRYLEDLKNLN